MLIPCTVIHRMEDHISCEVRRYRGIYDNESGQVFYDDELQLKLSRCDFHSGYCAYDVTDYAPIILRTLPYDNFAHFDFYEFYRRLKRISLYEFLMTEMRRDLDTNYEIQ